jgi:ABC-type uncharacterized transport system substrate-binding protein
MRGVSVFDFYRFLIIIPTFLGLVATIPDAKSQQTIAKVARIGYLGVAPRPPDEVFLQELRKLGYHEGENLFIGRRWGGNDDRTLAEVAESLVRSKVDVLVTVGSPPTRAARLATATIPIVFVAVGDPVAYGFVGSLARPDANLTGCSGGVAEIGPKGLQILKEIIPGAKRISILGNPRNPGNDSMVASLQTAASTFGLLLNYLDISRQIDLDRAEDILMKDRPDGLFVMPDLFLFTQRARIIGLTSNVRVAAVYGLREYALAGGLVALAFNESDMYRRAASYVDRLLKGAKPGDLPIEQPMRFDLMLNLKSAKSIGLDVPPTFLARVDEVIE